MVHAVNGLSIKMYQGQIFALLGHNGAGKTTTLQIITGLMQQTSGRINFLGCDLQENRRFLQPKIGVCPQENILFDLLSVEEHFQLFQAIKTTDPNKQQLQTQQSEKLIKDLELDEYRDTLAKNLSGGNRRKL